MAIELKVPEVGESITEVQIGQWLKDEGQSVEKDENLIEIETDKATLEIVAPESGTITRVLKRAGESAQVGEVIGYLEPSRVGHAVARVGEPSVESAEADEETTAAVHKQAVDSIGSSARPKKTRQPPQPAEKAEPKSGLEEPGGRARDDSRRSEAAADGALLMSLDIPRPVSRMREMPRPPRRSSSEETARYVSRAGDGREEEVVPMSPIRRRIAERLVSVQQTAALLTTFNEIDMSAVVALRNEHKKLFAERYGIKLGFMSFFVKAAIDALKNVPAVNAEIRGTDIVYHNYFDIGVAIGGGKGLVVPVLRDADRMSFAEIELSIADLAQRARENRLKLQELQGGTFTISNGGVYGSMLSTPILNPPQSGILGLHAIEDRPVARQGQVVIRPMMYVALTYDHRIVDGEGAVTFLKRVKDVVEEPMRMLVEI